MSAASCAATAPASGRRKVRKCPARASRGWHEGNAAEARHIERVEPVKEVGLEAVDMSVDGGHRQVQLVEQPLDRVEAIQAGSVKRRTQEP